MRTVYSSKAVPVVERNCNTIWSDAGADIDPLSVQTAPLVVKEAVLAQPDDSEASCFYASRLLAGMGIQTIAEWLRSVRDGQLAAEATTDFEFDKGGWMGLWTAPVMRWLRVGMVCLFLKMLWGVLTYDDSNVVLGRLCRIVGQRAILDDIKCQLRNGLLGEFLVGITLFVSDMF
jgi:hypothetical protein